MASLKQIEFPQKLQPLFRTSRYKVLYGGRGSGKSWGVARALIAKAVNQPLRILCAREVQNSIADSVYKLLVDQISIMGVSSFFDITQNQIRGMNGSEFFFTGIRGQTVENIKSFEGVDICWCEEAQSISKKSWTVLVPTIRKPGSEIWVTFNPDLDTDETYQRFVMHPPPDTQLIFLNYHDNPWFPSVLEAERTHLQQTDPVSYANIWEGKCRTAVDGAIYTNEIGTMIGEGRFRPVPHDPLLTAHTVWDLGWNDKMSIIIVQRLGAEIRIIDYLEDSHKTLADYIKVLEAKPYRYGIDYLPHDGAAKDFKTGKSAQEILMQLGRKVNIVPKMDVEQGIKTARLLLPRVYMDQDRTARLMDCLRRYRRTIPTTTGEPSGPLHDEYSHGADAFRYMAIVADQLNNDILKRDKIIYPKKAYA